MPTQADIDEALAMLDTVTDADIDKARKKAAERQAIADQRNAEERERAAKVERGIAKRAASLLADLDARETALRQQAAETLARAQLEHESGGVGYGQPPKTLTPGYIQRLRQANGQWE